MPGNALVQSLARGLDLLGLLAESEGGLRVSEVVAASGLKRPTAHNLLRTLVSRDFVVKDGVRYRLGPGVHMLVAAESSSAVLERAEDAVGLLAERVPDATVSYAEPVGSETLVRLRQFPKGYLMERNSGATLAPYQTASGLTVLAFGGPEVRQKISMRHPFPVEGMSVWQTEERLEKFLVEARGRGVILPPFCAESSFKLAAVPYLASNGKLVGVLGAARHVAPGAGESGTAEVVAALRDAAESMESQRT